MFKFCFPLFQDDNAKVIKSFRGALGVQCDDWESGIVSHIRRKSQARVLGLAPGMKIMAIDGQKFSRELLAKAVGDKNEHELTVIPIPIPITYTEKLANEKKVKTNLLS